MFILDSDGFCGLYSDKIYYVNDIIFTLSGPIYSEPTKTSIEIDFRKHIEDQYGKYLNHSFNNNCRIDGHNVIAVKNIKKNDELTFNYNESESYMNIPFKDVTTGNIVLGKNKKLICIRHAKTDSTNHNNNSLSENGINQCQNLLIDTEFQNLRNQIDLIVVSPLNRTLETSNRIFKNLNVPCICLDELLEFPQTYNKDSLRFTRDSLKKLYPHIIFYIPNEPFTSNSEENFETFEKRKESLQKWLYNRREKNIAIVGHNSFFKQMFKCDFDFIHCNPVIKYLK